MKHFSHDVVLARIFLSHASHFFPRNFGVFLAYPIRYLFYRFPDDFEFTHYSAGGLTTLFSHRRLWQDPFQQAE